LKSKEAVKARLKADDEKRHWEEKRRGLEDQIRQFRTACQELEEQYQVRAAESRDIELTSSRPGLRKHRIIVRRSRPREVLRPSGRKLREWSEHLRRGRPSE